MKKLWMAKVMTRGYDAPAWFFVAAVDEAEARSYCEDAETMVLEVVCPENVVSVVVAEFEGLALVN